MEEKREQSLTVEKLSKFLSEKFPDVKTKWSLDNDGEGIISEPLDEEIALDYQKELNQVSELNNKIKILGKGTQVKLYIPVQALAPELPLDIRKLIFSYTDFSTLKSIRQGSHFFKKEAEEIYKANLNKFKPEKEFAEDIEKACKYISCHSSSAKLPEYSEFEEGRIDIKIIKNKNDNNYTVHMFVYTPEGLLKAFHTSTIDAVDIKLLAQRYDLEQNEVEEELQRREKSMTPIANPFDQDMKEILEQASRWMIYKPYSIWVTDDPDKIVNIQVTIEKDKNFQGLYNVHVIYLNSDKTEDLALAESTLLDMATQYSGNQLKVDEELEKRNNDLSSDARPSNW